MRKRRFVSAGASSAVVASSLVGASTAFWPLGTAAAGAIALTLAAVAALARPLRPSPFSPVHLTVWLYLAVAAATVSVYPAVADAPFGTAFRTTLPTDLLAATALLYVLAAGSVLAGAACCLALTRGSGFGRRPVRLERIGSSEGTHTALLVVALVPFALIFAGTAGDLGVLLNRTYYLASLQANQQLFGFGANLALAVTLLAGYVWSASTAWTKRATSVAVALLYFILFFSLGSRSLAMAPIVFAMGAYATSPTSKRLKTLLLISVGVGLILLPLPLSLRLMDAHGLIPYLSNLAPDSPAVDVGAASLLLNLLQSVPTVAVTAFKEPALPLWVSLNPLPGNVAGWYAVSDAYRLNVNAPYPALGELANRSVLVVATYFAVAGFVLARTDLAIRRLMARGHQLYALLLVAVSGLFAVFSLQYNLRTTTRFLYYLTALTLLAAIVPRLLAAARGLYSRRYRTRHREPGLTRPRGL